VNYGEICCKLSANINHCKGCYRKSQSNQQNGEEFSSLIQIKSHFRPAVRGHNLGNGLAPCSVGHLGGDPAIDEAHFMQHLDPSINLIQVGYILLQTRSRAMLSLALVILKSAVNLPGAPLKRAS
jgi:hypothetical protein